MKRLLVLALVLAPFAFAGDGPRVVDEWLAGERPAEKFPIREIVVFSKGRRILVSTGQELKTAVADEDFETHPFLDMQAHTRVAAVTSNGKLLAAADWYGRWVAIYNVPHARKIKNLDRLENVYALGFSPRGDRLLVAGYGHGLDLVDVKTGNVAASTSLSGSIAGCGFTDGGAHAWLANTSGEIRFYDPETLRCMRTRKLDQEMTLARLSESGDTLVYCTTQKVERVNLLTDARKSWVPDEAPGALGVSPDGSLIVVSGESGRLTFLAGTGGGYQGHVDEIRGLAISPTGSLAVSTSLDGSARLWQTRTGKHLRILEPERATGPVSFSDDGAKVLLASEEGLLRIDPRTNARFAPDETPHDPSAAEEAVRFGQAGERTWKLQVGQRFAPEAITGYPFALAVTPSRKRALVVASDLTLWDLEKPGRLYVYENCPNAAASPIAFSPDEKLAAVYHSDHKLRLWKLEAPWAASLVDLGRAVPTALAFAPDGRWLLVGTTKGRILKVELGSSR
ncbi:MAG TPA: WD40 repeat domain-containing protein [Planctomycetota bacterium]|nr:WD40 repeat domain-containing protein [Planctomycetota bacterium]